MRSVLNLISSRLQRRGPQEDQASVTEACEGTSLRGDDVTSQATCSEQPRSTASSVISPTTAPPSIPVEDQATQDISSEDRTGNRGDENALEDEAESTEPESEYLDSIEAYCRYHNINENGPGGASSPTDLGSGFSSSWRGNAAAPASDLNRAPEEAAAGTVVLSVDGLNPWAIDDSYRRLVNAHDTYPPGKGEVDMPADTLWSMEDTCLRGYERLLARRIARAVTALQDGRCVEALHMVLNAQSEAREAGLEALDGKCFFWRAVAMYNLADYQEASRSIFRAERCRHQYTERRWIEEYSEKIEAKLMLDRCSSAAF